MKRVGLWIMLGLLLAACAPTVGTPASKSTVESAPAAPAANVPTAVSPTVEVRPATDVASPAAASAAPTNAPTKKAVKAELEATDPGTVQLAAGKPQFVEFFAFW